MELGGEVGPNVVSTRAGSDCAGHLFRAMTDIDPTTILSIDGIGAYDHVLRSASD